MSRRKKPPIVIIDGTYENPSLDRDFLIGRAIEDHDPTPVKPVTHDTKRPRLELNNARQEFRIDETWYPLTTDKKVFFLDVLMKQAGVRIAGKHLEMTTYERARPDKILKSLPRPIQEIIEVERGPAGGYRIKPEYFE